jgi:hypothetical protein
VEALRSGIPWFARLRAIVQPRTRRFSPRALVDSAWKNAYNEYFNISSGTGTISCFSSTARETTGDEIRSGKFQLPRGFQPRDWDTSSRRAPGLTSRHNQRLLGSRVLRTWQSARAKNLVPRQNPAPCRPMQQNRLECNLAQIERAKSEPFELTANGPNVFVKRSALKFSDAPIELELVHSRRSREV